MKDSGQVLCQFSGVKITVIGCGVVLFLYLLVEIGFLSAIGSTPTLAVGNSLALQRSRQDLHRAKAQWDAQEITSYQIKVSLHYYFLADSCGGLLVDTLTIKEAQVISSTEITKGNVRPTCLKAYNALTIADMFALAEQELTTADPFRTQAHIEFDPVFGFITRYTITKGPSGGLFGPPPPNPSVASFSDFIRLDNK